MTGTPEIYVTEHSEFSRLLGPDGRPLPYTKPEPVGFRLTPSTNADKLNKDFEL